MILNYHHRLATTHTMSVIGLPGCFDDASLLRNAGTDRLFKAAVDLRDFPAVAPLDAENVSAREAAYPEEYTAEV